MGLIKDIKDIQPFIDISNLKGSLQEGDIIITGFSPYIVIYDQQFLQQIRLYFTKKFLKSCGSFLLICAGGFMDTNSYDDKLNLIDSPYDKHWAINKIYRKNSKLTDEEKTLIKDMLDDEKNQTLQNLIQSKNYSLIWER